MTQGSTRCSTAAARGEWKPRVLVVIVMVIVRAVSGSLEFWSLGLALVLVLVLGLVLRLKLRLGLRLGL